MKILKKDIKPNEVITTFFVLESMQLRKSKDNREFLMLNLYDKTGKIKGYLWNNPVGAAYMLKEKSFVKVKGIVTEVNNKLLIINVEKIRMAEKEEIDENDFFTIVPLGIDYWHNMLIHYAELITDKNCKNLTDEFINDEEFMSVFSRTPAGVSVHHHYIGGLLEHTVNIMAQASIIADNHKSIINKNLLITGAFLHDVGKTREIHCEMGKEYTTEGKLLGHISIGISMIEERIRNLNDFPEDLTISLKHMILSHHGEKDFGSPVIPATPEAVALHLIDNLDAKLNHIYCHLENADHDKTWSHFDNILKTEIYQRKQPENIPEEIQEAA